MAQRYDQLYKIKQGDDLGDPTRWNPKFQDIDLRLAALEGTFSKIDAAVAEVTALGISRLNTTFAPLIQSLTNQINATNALVAQAQADVATLENILSTTVVLDGGTF
jgi:hypothetical protein